MPYENCPNIKYFGTFYEIQVAVSFSSGQIKKVFVKQLYNGGSDYPKVHKVGRFPCVKYMWISSIRHSCLRNMYQRIDQTLSNRGPALGVFTRLLQQEK